MDDEDAGQPSSGIPDDQVDGEADPDAGQPSSGIADDQVGAEAVATPATPESVPVAPPPQTEQFAVTIGDIGVTRNWVVTPNGNAPVAGSRWIVLDQSRTERKIPTWAIVLAIVFAVLCLIGLLFLLVKEDR